MLKWLPCMPRKPQVWGSSLIALHVMALAAAQARKGLEMSIGDVVPSRPLHTNHAHNVQPLDLHGAHGGAPYSKTWLASTMIDTSGNLVSRSMLARYPAEPIPIVLCLDSMREASSFLHAIKHASGHFMQGKVA